MSPERDYSHRSTIQKLGVKPDQRVEITGDVGPGDLAVSRSRQRNVSGWVARKRAGTKTARAAEAGTRAATAIARVPHVMTMHGNQKMTAAWRRRAALRLAFRHGGTAAAVSRATKLQLDEDLGLDPRLVVSRGAASHPPMK